ncbi:MAG: PEP-CTERM sorting domain-containing protein, partial [Planctomycetota bacterium]|nr:PEP-CTERM sorting domain-containing protein [Planctomycetota bacterium]
FAARSMAAEYTTTRKTLVTKSLVLAGTSTAPTAKLDLSDGRLVINYEGDSPIATIFAQIVAAFNPGTMGWDGGVGIGSNLLTTDPYGGRAIGFAENSLLPLPYGPATEYSEANPFGDTTDVAPNAILVRYTLIGDVDLNGVVNDDDITLLTGNYLGTGMDWFGGDVFMYDGVVGDDDVTLQAGNYLGSVGQVTGGFVGVGEIGAVPEPATMGLLLLGGAALLARRRRAGR